MRDHTLALRSQRGLNLILAVTGGIDSVTGLEHVVSICGQYVG